MRRAPVAVGVAILLVAIAAGIAALLLNGPGGSTPISAAEACNFMDTPYDALLTGATPLGEARAEIRYSGSDRHRVTTITDHEGVLLGKSEAITKDRTRYSRESTQDNPEVYGEWRVHGTNVPRSSPLPCLDPGSFEQGASGSSDEPHFTSERFLSEEEGAVRNEFWADSTGRPTRARRTQFLPEYDGVTNTETIVVDFTYSGYGEPNVIEAPCASAAPDQAGNPGLMADCIHLLAARDTLRGTASLNWSVETPIRQWDGVSTTGSPPRVTQLRLVSQGLDGTIPPELARLPLTSLRLNGNMLTGPIPPALGEMAALESLRLNGNRLTGAIPGELGQLTALRELWLARNMLSGEIPATLGQLAQLERLSLSENDLSGAIPATQAQLARLEQLGLSQNDLTGAIPPGLANLERLHRLRLRGNDLSGCVPPTLRDVRDNDLHHLGLPDCPG